MKQDVLLLVLAYQHQKLLRKLGVSVNIIDDLYKSKYIEVAFLLDIQNIEDASVGVIQVALIYQQTQLINKSRKCDLGLILLLGKRSIKYFGKDVTFETK